MALDVSGLRPLDTSGLTEVGGQLDTSGLRPLDTSGLTPLHEQGRLSSAAGSFMQGAGQVFSGTAKSIAFTGTPDARVFDQLDLIDRGVRFAPSREGFRASEGLLLAYQNATPEERQQIRQELQARIEAIPKSRAYQVGEQIDRWFAENFPTNPAYADEFWTSKVPQALGSATAFVLGSLATRGAGAPFGAAGRVIGSYAGAAGLGSATNRVQQFDDALASGADILTALRAAELGGIVGTTEAIPIGNLLNRLDTGTGGAVRRWIRRAMIQGTEEAVQEAFSGIMNAAIAQGLYDPSRGVWTAERAEEAAVGFTTGAILETLFSIAMPGRTRAAGTTQRAPDIGEPAEAAPPGEREKAVAQAQQPTPDDIESPIPTDLIQQGREILADAEGQQSANRMLEQAGLPPVGTTIRLRTITGGETGATIVDAIDDGGWQGAKVRFDSGREVAITFEALRNRWLREEPAAEPDEDAEGRLESSEFVPQEPTAATESFQQEVPTDAEAVRGDEGRIQAPGLERPGGEGEGRPDLQLEPQAEPAARDEQAAPQRTSEPVITEPAEGLEDRGLGPAAAQAVDEVTPQAAADPTSSAPAKAVRRPDGTAFPNALAAGAARVRAGLKETHDIVRAEGGGFELRPKGSATTAVAQPPTPVAPTDQAPAEASQPADDGAAQWNALTPAGRRAALKAAGVKLPDAVMWEHISDEDKQKLRPVVSNMLERATDPQAAPAPAPAPAATQTAVAEPSDGVVPHFETYDDAYDWIERRAKELGMSLRAFSSTDEYKAIYPQIEALYQDQKAKTSEQRMAALRDAGLAVGDRVKTTFIGMFLNAEDYYGTIVLRGGEPWVKLDGTITVSKKGRLREASMVRWDPRWKKVTETAGAPAESTPAATQAEQAPASQGAEAASAAPQSESPLQRSLREASERAAAAATSEASVEPRAATTGPAKTERPTKKYGRSGAAALNAMAKAAGLTTTPDDSIADGDSRALIEFFDKFYFAGLEGRDMPRPEIHPDDARKAYEAGVKDRKREAQQAAGGAPATTQRGGWRLIGTNASGNPLFEDERGVRSYTEGGVRITEKVRIIPGRGISIDKDSRGDEFLTAEERAASQMADRLLQIADASQDIRQRRQQAPVPAPASTEARAGESAQEAAPTETAPAEPATVEPTVEPTEDATDGVQVPVPSSDAGSGAAAVQPVAAERPAGEAPSRQERGGAPDVRRADREPAEAADRPAVPGGRKAGPGDADRVPERGTRAERSAREAARRVAGENFVIEPGALAEERGRLQKARDNIRAIELMRQIEAEGRLATREEQAQLALYVGWGGLKGAFPDPKTGQFEKGFERVGERLRELLNDTEYETARRSLQYAHYTSETVVRAMWEAAQRLGFNGGMVFEPGMGVGNFPGMMPSDLAARTDYHGLELDQTTARIARLLYPKWGVRQDDFTKAPLPKDTYDLVIGNPPFADIAVRSDPAYPQGFLLHDYFFAKSLDAVRPGGLLMFVTSAGTMNKIDTSAREYLADRADLVGAIRLPGSAFERYAATKVTTDILILRKRLPDEQPGDRSWVETVEVTLPNKEGKPTKGRVNRYFVEHPEMVLGEEGFFDPLYAGRYAVRAPKDFDLAAALREAIGRLPEGVMSEWARPTERAEIDFGTAEHKDGSYYIGRDGQLMQMIDGVGRPVQRRGKGVEGGKSFAEIERIKALIPIRDALRAVYAADLDNDTANAEKARKRLNEAYDAFVKRFGPINKAEFRHRRPTIVQQEAARQEAREEARYSGAPWREGDFDDRPLIARGASMAEIARARQEAREQAKKKGRPFDEGSFNPEDMPDVVIEKRPNIDPFMDDPESYRLRAIEHYNDQTGEAEKSDVFFRNIITREREPEIRSVNDALLWTIHQKGRLDIEEVARLAKVTVSEAIEQLGDKIFRLPGTANQWVTRDEYLSGNVRKKLREAQAAAENDPSFRRNVEALTAVLPPPIPPSEIDAHLGMPWIPTEVIEEFAVKALGLGRAKVKYVPILAQWEVRGDTESAAARSTWGTSDVHAIALLQHALNRTDPRVYREIRTPEGTERELDEVATQAAQEKMLAIKQRFSEWIWSDEERAIRLANHYNEEYNSLVVREYDGSYLTTPGVSATWQWRPHQKRVIARIIQSGNTYMAHAVGAGKTSAMIGAGMEMRRLGLVRKPMYVVPNHMLAQFTKEFYEQYPLARIAVADERNFHTSRRKQFIANVATEDLDAIIITHSAFGMIPISNEFQDALIKEQVAQYRKALESIGKDSDTRITRARLEKQIERLEQRLSGRSQARKDQVFTFEEMGVDFLFVDEAHIFRKLDFATKMSNIKGISPTGSKAAWDLYTKIRYLESKRPGRSVVLASGTPITNTMAELYSISRYLQANELKERGLEEFDAWAGAFGDTVTQLEQNPAGGYAPVTRFAKFVNVPELSAMVRQVMDVVTSRQLEQYVTRPKLKGGKRIMNLAERSPLLTMYQQSLADRMDAIAKRKGPPKPGDDIILNVINDGRHAAIDMRLVDPELPNDPGSKLNLLIENVYRIWKETKVKDFYRPEAGGYSKEPIDRGPATQMIFANLGVSTARGFSVHDYIRSELIRRGVPKEEIANIRDYKSHVAKQRLFNDMNDGKVRILIGTTAKMATGVNAQRRLYAIHNLDPLWYPADDEQRNGRILRQGNMNPEVEIHDYSTKGTYDSTMWGLMETKARFIQGFFEGDPSIRSMEDLGEASQYEQAKAISTADPRLIKLTELRQELERARRRKAAFEAERAAIRHRLASERNNLEFFRERVKFVEEDIARRKDTSGDKFRMVVGGKTYTDRLEAGTELLRTLGELRDKGQRFKLRKIGEIGGFDLVVNGWMDAERKFFVSLAILRSGNREHQVVATETARGVIMSIESILRGFEDDLSYAKSRISDAEQAIRDFEPKLGERFTGQAEIDQLTEQVRQLEREIAEAPRESAQAPLAQPQEDAANEGGAVREGDERFSLRNAEPVVTNLDPRFAAEAQRVTAALEARLRQLGISDRVALRLRERIQAVADGRATEADARYLQGVIEVSLQAPDTTRALNHEVIHALRDLGLIRPLEWRTLERAARADADRMAEIRRLYAGQRLSEEALVEEAVADMYADWAAGRLEADGGPLRRALRRIRDFFRALGNALRGAGFQTAEDVFQRIERGEVGRREAWRQQPRDELGRFASPDDPRYAAQRPRDVTETEEFRRWFGDSKVVDEHGQPLVVYHGSPAGDFDVFRPKSYGTAGEHSYFYFAKSKTWANRFLKEEARSKGKVRSFFLSIQNPLDLRGRYLTGEQWIELLTSLGVKVNPWLDERLTQAARRVIPAWRLFRFDTPNTSNLRAELMSLGYDGLILYDTIRGRSDNTVFVAFRPEQVKSATGNRGTFDPNDPRIRYSLSRESTDDSRAGEGRSFTLARRATPQAQSVDTPAPTFDDPESERRWQEARKGLGGSISLMQRLNERWDYIKAGFARHFIHLPNEPRFADAREQLRKLEAAPQAAKEEVVRNLRRIVQGMSREDLDLFTRKLVLDDLMWEVEQEHELPFGLTAADVPRELAKVDAALAKRPDLMEKVRLRNRIMRELADDLVEAGVLHKEQVQNPAYYRHQVLEYARAEVAAGRLRAKGTGKKLRTPQWAKRKGSTLDINANYLEVEFEWMQKALMDIAAARTIDWLKNSEHNIRDRLVQKAKAHNDALIRRLLDKDLEEHGYVVREDKETGALISSSPLNDEWKAFKQRIAVGLRKIRDAIDNGELTDIPQQFRNVADDLAAGVQAEDSIFPFLAWILDNNKPGAMGAAQVFKAINQRKAWIRAHLGDQYADPMDIDGLVRRFAPEGYVTWQPDEGRLFFVAKTIPEHVIDRMLERIATEGGGAISAEELSGALQSVRSMLAVAGPKYQLVIPEELAATLNSLRDEHADGLFDALLAEPMAWWKRWVLINPRRVLKYNLTNLSGDLDAIIAGNPRALRKMPQAIKELWHVMKGGEPSARYREAVERGVFDSGLSVQEIPDIKYLSEFEHLLEPPTLRQPVRFVLSPFMRIWRALQKYTQFRENWLRYAAYLDYVERLEAGEPMKSIGYGAAVPKMVDAVEDPKDKAALLARELVGDYGAISHFGKGIRRKVIPFWSWMEINAKRYWRLGLNAWNQGIGQGFRTTGIIGATLGVRTSAYLFLRMAVFYALVKLWNNLFFGDEEDELSEQDRARLHVILGRDEDGKIRMLRLQGAFSDFLGWFGAEDVAVAMSEVEKGRADVGDVLTAMAKAPVNKLASGLTPVITVPVEMATGRQIWPDITRMRPISDRWRRVAELFSAEHEYDLIFDRPSRGYAYSLEELVTAKRDARELAYSRIKGMAYDWLRREKGVTGSGDYETPRSKALRDWRMAKRYGDKTAERKALDRLIELGVKREDLRQSIKRAHPLGAIPLKDRAAFLRTLTPRERELLDEAIEWYKEIYLE